MLPCMIEDFDSIREGSRDHLFTCTNRYAGIVTLMARMKLSLQYSVADQLALQTGDVVIS